MKRFISLSLISLLAACSSVPDKLVVNDGQPLTNFANEVANPGNNQGDLARWGGVIAKVENKAEHTIIEVVNFKLTSSARPKKSDETLGRFRIRYQGLLDPVIYQEGKSITAVGKIASAEQGAIGEHEYNFPVLDASAVHLWREIKQVDRQIIYDPFWYSPAGYWRYPYHARTRGVGVVYRKSGNANTSANTTGSK